MAADPSGPGPRPPAHAGEAGARAGSRGQLERARRVQLGMLPRTPQIPGLAIHAHYAPCAEVGGDFYDLVPVAPDALAVIVGDVAGHGLDAALVMASAKKSIQVHSQGRTSPAEVLRIVAEDLAPELPPGVFFTVFHGVVDMREGALRFARAGHSPLLRFNPRRSPLVETYQPDGMPVGAVPPDQFAARLEERRLDLFPGDVLVQFTDGLAEAMDADRREYGEERLCAVIAAAGDAPPDALAARILADVSGFRGATPSADDVTLVILRYEGTGAATPPAPAAATGNLPAAATSFVGRALDRRRLAEWCRAEPARVVTITGPGGAGKTRVAVEVARDLQGDFPGGCWFADCAEARTADQVAAAVARALGRTLAPGRPAGQAVGEMLAHRPPLLLVVDNLEQALPAMDATLHAWNREAPAARLLATSREPLGLPGERVYGLGLLPVPPERAGVTAAEAGAYDAVKLFLDRGRQARPEFDLDSENAADVAQIVRALDGLPLALELAATRLSVASPAEIVGMLDRKFELLHAARPGAPARQHSLAAAIDFSYEQLGLAEQHVFQQLSVFHGGCLFEAASAVAETGSVPGAPPLLDVLESLRKKSFVRVTPAARTTRFELYSTLRDYAAARWSAAARPAARRALAERFVEHLAGYLEDWSARLRGPAACDVLDRIAAETENAFAAFDHAMALGRPLPAARVILALAPTMAVRGPTGERVPRLEQARAALADLPADPTVRRLQVELTLELAAARSGSGALPMAADDAQMAVLAADALGDPVLRARALAGEAQQRMSQAQYLEAGTVLDAAQRAAGDAAPAWLRADLALMRVRLPLLQGAVEVAMRALDAAEPVVRTLGCPRTLATLLHYRGSGHLSRGEHALAASCYAEAETLAYELHDLAGVSGALGSRGIALWKLGAFDDALAAFLDAETIARDIGNLIEVARHLGNRGDVLILLGRLDDAIRCTTEAIGLLRGLGHHRGEAFALETRGWALSRAARHAEARDDLHRAIELFDASGADQPLARFSMHARLARVEHALGHRNEARREGAHALDLAAAQGIDEDHPDPGVREAWEAVRELLAREGTTRRRRR